MFAYGSTKEIKMRKLPSPPIAFAGALVLFAMLTLNLEAAFGRDTTYRCTVKDAVGVQADGTLNKDDPRAKAAREHFDRMALDVPGGDITYPTEGRRENRVVQRTSVRGDYVLVSDFYFGRNKTAANATTDFIRLHIPADNLQAIFAAFQLSSLVTGTCDIVK
jgi:hypothetical protein